MQEEGHPPHPSDLAKRRVTQPPSRDPDGVSPGRLALWAIVAALVLVGIYLYFRHQAKITPLLG